MTGTNIPGSSALAQAGTQGGHTLTAIQSGLKHLSRAWAYPVAGSKRDLRLDMLRGLAALAMIVDHIGGKDSLLYLMSGGDRFFVSAAEGFVFISGLVMGTVYAGVLAKAGLRVALAKGAKRVAILYGLTVGLSLLFAAISLGLALPWAPDVSSTSSAFSFVTGILTLHRAYYLTDVLLLYTLVIAASLPALAFMYRWRHAGWLVLGGSWALWAAWQWWPLWVQLPLGITVGDMFRFPAWQVLFVSGLVLGYYRKAIERWTAAVLHRCMGVVRGSALVLSAMAVGGSIGFYVWAQANPQETTLVSQLGQLFGKSDLRVGRLALFALLIVGLFQLCTVAWSPIKRTLGTLLLPLGQDALTVYTLHLFVVALLTTVDAQLLGSQADTLLGRTLMQAAGIALIWSALKAKPSLRAFCAGACNQSVARLRRLQTSADTPRVVRGIIGVTSQLPRAWAHFTGGFLGSQASGIRGRLVLALTGVIVASIVIIPQGSALAMALKSSSVVTTASNAPSTSSTSSTSRELATGDAPDGTGAGSLAMMMSGTAAPQSAATATPVVLPSYVEQGTFVSASLKRSMPYYIYLPPSYLSHPEARYPVIYMLHGMSGTNTEWLGYGLVGRAHDMMAAGQISEFIIVLPQGDQGYWVDHPNGGPLWGTYVARDLVSEVDNSYRTMADRGHRAIGGLSMGGSGALELAILYPNVFGTAGADSPSLHTYNTAPPFYGSQDYFNAHDPMYLYKAHPEIARTLKLYIDVGQQDAWMPAANSFQAVLQAGGVAYEWHLFPGGHEGTYWSTHVPDYLLFYSSALASQSPATPTPTVSATPLPTRMPSPARCGGIRNQCAY